MSVALSRLEMGAGPSSSTGQLQRTWVWQEGEGLVILERVWGDTIRKVEGCISDTIGPIPWEGGGPEHQRNLRQVGMDRRQGIRRLAYNTQWGRVPQPLRDALADWCLARSRAP